MRGDDRRACEAEAFVLGACRFAPAPEARCRKCVGMRPVKRAACGRICVKAAAGACVYIYSAACQATLPTPLAFISFTERRGPCPAQVDVVLSRPPRPATLLGDDALHTGSIGMQRRQRLLSAFVRVSTEAQPERRAEGGSERGKQ